MLAVLGTTCPDSSARAASVDVAMLDADQLPPLLDSSFRCEPVRLGTVGKLQLYLIWESVRSIEAGIASQLMMVFASPSLPYRGAARFGYARWSLDRFSESII